MELAVLDQDNLPDPVLRKQWKIVETSWNFMVPGNLPGNVPRTLPTHETNATMVPETHRLQSMLGTNGAIMMYLWYLVVWLSQKCIKRHLLT